MPEVNLDDCAAGVEHLPECSGHPGRSIEWNDWPKLITQKVPKDPGSSSVRDLSESTDGPVVDWRFGRSRRRVHNPKVGS